MAAGGNGEPSEKGQHGSVDIVPGCLVWCKTRFEEIKGTVSAYDQENGALIIKSPCVGANCKPNFFDISVVNIRQLEQQNFKLLQSPKSVIQSLSELDHGKVKRRLEEASSEKAERASNTGHNVTPEAQGLFDMLKSQYRESTWERENIIVMDVKIYPPYRSENCLGQEEDTRQLQQIRKMVEKFHNERQNNC